ncbi:MAG: lipoate--protein ligase family protein [Bacteroidota bacterium]
MHYINTGFHSGEWNMAFDVFLATQLQKKTILPTLRCYGWSPFALSLGYNQNDSFINKEKCRSENVSIVRRPTGGRAIYHSEEMTYSIVVFHQEKNISALHNEISLALVEGVNMLGVNAVLSTESSSATEMYKGKNSAACFSSIARSEIQVNGKKIAGSAQRRFNDVVLQHGSVMLGDKHKQLPFFYKEHSEEFFMNLTHSTAEVNSLLHRQVSFEEAAAVIQQGFKKKWNVEFAEFPPVILEKFSEAEYYSATMLTQ